MSIDLKPGNQTLVVVQAEVQAEVQVSEQERGHTVSIVAEGEEEEEGAEEGTYEADLVEIADVEMGYMVVDPC